MYRPLAGLLEAAHANGMRTLVSTNGLLLDPERLDPLIGRLDMLAVSLDGPPEDHDRMRARPGAFADMVGGLPALRASGIPFAFLFTLTLHNVHQLEWAASFALSHGASFLQVHPLEATGRGANLAASVPDAIEGSFALLEAQRVEQTYGGRLRIYVDMVTRQALAAHPDTVYADGHDLAADIPLSRLVSPLVVEPDGICVPLEYGFPRQYAFGDIRRQRLAEAAASWRRSVYPSFHRHCLLAYEQLVSPSGPAVVDWYASVAATRPARRTHPWGN